MSNPSFIHNSARIVNPPARHQPNAIHHSTVVPALRDGLPGYEPPQYVDMEGMEVDIVHLLCEVRRVSV